MYTYTHIDASTHKYETCVQVCMYVRIHKHRRKYVRDYICATYLFILVFEPDVQADAAETPGNAPPKRHQTASPPKEASHKKDPGAVGGQRSEASPQKSETEHDRIRIYIF